MSENNRWKERGKPPFLLIKEFEDDPIPEGFKREGEAYFYRGYFPRGRFAAKIQITPGPLFLNSFEVENSHKKLENGDGVVFNVETVPKASLHYTCQERVQEENLYTTFKTLASKFYREKLYPAIRVNPFLHGKPKEMPKIPNRLIHLESFGREEGKLVYAETNSFLACAMTAFAQHLPLSLSADHVWALITYAFARHVKQHSHQLEKMMFDPKSNRKKVLEVRTRSDFKISQKGKPCSGESSQVWEREVIAEFSGKIREQVKDKVYTTVVAAFSTTTQTTRAASEITLMSAMNNYFEYRLSTLCGIPSVTLLGCEEDWVALRQKAEDLGRYMTKDFRKYWLPLLLPVLDKFVESFRGNVDHSFWQTMIKIRRTGFGSGSHDFISGWLQIFYPYLKEELNENLRAWDELYFRGPKPQEFSTPITSARVSWDYHDKNFPLHFHAGFVGFTQAEDYSGCLTPCLGWFITHDPNKEDIELDPINETLVN